MWIQKQSQRFKHTAAVDKYRFVGLIFRYNIDKKTKNILAS